MTNKFGLSRNIPVDVKREIRRRSRFGCVVCRCAFYQYEHIDPEFHEAQEHDPIRMCLLCGHCHDKVTRGSLSKSTVRRRYEEIQEKKDVERPFDQFDLENDNITVILGSCIFKNAKSLIILNGDVVLAIEPPEEQSAFPVLSGYFSDSDGNEIMRVERNEWIGPSIAWDMEICGNEIFIRSAPETIALHLRVAPPNAIEVVNLNMRVGNSHLVLRNNLLSVGRIAADAEYYVGIQRLECTGAEVGVSVDEKGIEIPRMEGLTIGDGIELKGTGIKLAVGAAGPTFIRGLVLEEATKLATVITEFPLTTSLLGTRTVHAPRI